MFLIVIMSLRMLSGKKWYSMIIFHLDGTLANIDHRRHLVDPKKNSKFKRRWDATLDECKNNKSISEEYIPIETTRQDCLNENFKKFKSDWKSFHEACDKDEVNLPVWKMFVDSLKIGLSKDIQIWSGRCESVRVKTEHWLMKNLSPVTNCDIPIIKMRPIGDSTPEEQIKEMWLNERCDDHIKAALKGSPYGMKHDIEYVFDSDDKSIEMWRRRSIFIFNCAQHDEDF